MTIAQAALQYAGRGKYSITPVSDPIDAAIISDHTYSLADADQVRQAIGWEHGSDHWAFNVGGTPKVLTGETVLFYGGQRVSAGQVISDGILPLSAQPCKGHALPIGTRKITAFPGVASQSQINEAAE